MSEKKKTLVILTPGFAKDEADSVCIPSQQSFIKTLNKAHPALNIIILTMEYPFFKGIYNWFGNTVISFEGKNKDIRKLFLRRRVYSKLNELVKENNVVGLLSFWCNECALIAKRFADKNNIRHVCWIWGQDAKKENRYPGRLAPQANELATLSDFLQDEFEKNHGIRPTYVVPPGIDHQQYNVSATQKDIDVLAAGSLIPLKQYEIFIDVIDEVRKNLPGLKAIMIGKGPEKNKLMSLIEKKGLTSNIMLTGELQHNVVLSYMKRARVFLHPSSYEGFGIVCIEALGAGVDVISFVKPMQREIENWHVVKNKEEMIGETTRILQDQKKEYRSVIPYTIEETVQKMSELFSF
jgi:glycosyltransferase involved in cell wall biosynthesis